MGLVTHLDAILHTYDEDESHFIRKGPLNGISILLILVFRGSSFNQGFTDEAVDW